jgi:Ca-activated chloride channel family protein
MRWNRFVIVAVAVCCLIAGRAGAAERGLRLHDAKGGKLIEAPVLGTTVEIRVTGIIARARVTQIYTNPTQEWLEGIYYFPLPDGAAVDTVHMRVGERVLEGVVQEKQEARQTYETAKEQGTKATLIEQRNGVFTTSLANIGPGETVEVAIELQQIVHYAKGRFTLRFPMVVAPQSLKALRPPVVPAGRKPINPFALHIDLAPGFPVARVESPSHRIAVEKGKGKDGRQRWAVDLADGTAPADSDFVLDWVPVVGRSPRAVFFSETVDGEQYSLLMMMPPDDLNDFTGPAARLPRETLFIIDTSGSMSGTSIEQARQALLVGIDRLQPGDWLNVIQFNSKADALFPASVPADPDHLERARQYVRALQATGDTEMLPALQIALGKLGQGGAVQQVIFVTDGLVNNEAELLAYIGRSLGGHRLFTVAIGPSPNAAFLRKAAEIGRGTFTAISTVDQVAQGMGTLIAQLDAPMLRQIDVRWADPAAEVWPPRVPDLYLGEPLVLTARQRSGGPVAVSGLRNGQSWSDELPGAAVIKNAGIDKLWARQKIDSLLDTLATDRNADRAEIQRQVTELGLRHHLVTVHTSLVAVDVEPTAPAGVKPATRVLPVNAPRRKNRADVITVLGETPLLDERRISSSSTVSAAELAKIPTARDSWAVDGVVITDMAALGAASGYYDFDVFGEVAAADPSGMARFLAALKASKLTYDFAAKRPAADPAREKGCPPQDALGERKGDRVAVALGGVDKEWVPYLLCKAVWRYEDDYRRAALGAAAGKDYAWSIQEERECLTAYMADNLARGGTVPELARHLDEVIRAGLLDGFIGAVVLGPRCSTTASPIPQQALEQAELYRRKFGLAPAR